MEWIDISLPLRPGMPQWPGDPHIRFERVAELAAGDDYTLSQVCMGLHTGTHLDAPCHFLAGAPGLEAMPLDTTIGPARILNFEDIPLIGGEELSDSGVESGERVLLKTANSLRGYGNGSWQEDFSHLTPGGARWLVDRGVRLIGIDYLSIAGMEDGPEVHSLLLAGGVWILEGIDLAEVEPGICQLCCLPLAIFGRDGAPARALVLPGQAG